MTTPDDVFDLIEQPEDVTPPMARERAFSDALLAALRLAHGDKALFREAEKARAKGSRKRYRIYTVSEREEWHRLFNSGISKSDIVRRTGATMGPVYRELTSKE